ncbi:MAG: hypothetical protein ACOWWR_05220 [Eubacteriales bacterium]
MNELEFVLNKIIDIDNKSSQVKNNTVETIQQKETTLNNALKDLENSYLSKTKNEMQRQYEEIMQQSKKETEKIIKDAETDCKMIMEKYNAIKNGLKDEILQEILKL